MDGILRLLSVLSLPITGVMFILLARRVGREQPSRMRTYVIGILMPGLMMGVNLLFMLRAFLAWCPGIWLLVLTGGMAFGYLWGKASKIYPKGDILVIKRTVLHLGFWAISYTLTHLLSALLPASIAAVGMAMMFFSTGSAVGMNTNLILRQRKLALAPSALRTPSAAPAAGRRCSNCGAPVNARYRFCIQCGRPIKA